MPGAPGSATSTASPTNRLTDQPPHRPTASPTNRLTDQPSAADVLLHGDPAEVNTIETPQGQLYFLDPVTSTGPRELDWARFASRLHWHGGHSPFDAGELIGTIVETDSTLDIGRLCLAFASDYRLGALPASTREHLGPHYARGLLAAAGSLSDLSRRVEPAPAQAATRQTVLAISHSLHEAERTFEAQRAVHRRSPGHEVAMSTTRP